MVSPELVHPPADDLDELVLKPSKPRTALLLAFSIVFTLGGWWMISDHDPWGWFVFGFFGLCASVFIVQLLPGSTYLRLNKNGFQTRTLYRYSKLIKWSDIDRFCVVDIQGRKMVGIMFAPDYTKRPVARALNMTLAGVDSALPNTYGMKAEELAWLMQSRKVAASIS